MWYEKNSAGDWSESIRHLSRDPVMKSIIKKVGPCTLSPRKDYFLMLCGSIYSQQVSTHVADVLFNRFKDLFPRRNPTPAAVHKLLSDPQANIESCGLSRQKKKYLIDLAKHFVENKIPTRKLSRMSDDEIIEALTAVHGIGRWTAEMFLIFVLNRPDVLPVDDLGFQEAIKRAYELRERPNAKKITKLAESWGPHRTLATWYMWRSLRLDRENVKPKKRE